MAMGKNFSLAAQFMGGQVSGKSNVLAMYDSIIAPAYLVSNNAGTRVMGTTPAVGAGSYTNTTGKTLTIHAFCWGSGAQVNTTQGPSGANAGYKKFRLAPGQSFSWNIGDIGAGPTSANGPDTTLTLPNGETLTVAGGRTSGGNPGENSGSWDLARKGGKGGSGAGAGSNPPDGFGSSGNNASSGLGGSGGTAGFLDFGEIGRPGFPGGTNGSTPGGAAPGGSVNAGFQSAWMGAIRFVGIDEG